MPYIPKDQREKLTERDPINGGELNYMITLLIKRYIEANGLCYQTINDVYGALTGAQLEFARRVVNTYEDGKVKQNGDVY